MSERLNAILLRVQWAALGGLVSALACAGIMACREWPVIERTVTVRGGSSLVGSGQMPGVMFSPPRETSGVLNEDRRK